MRVYVHVGPPKTGTSAIQHWCSENRQILEAQRVYYPSHALDENGVSSGNLLSIYDRDETTGELTYNADKYHVLVEKAAQAGAQSILLSSEFFFKRVTELEQKIPNAIFIAYIRFELEVLESNYNQSVKRHGKVEPLNTPKKVVSRSINLLTQHIKAVGKSKFCLRAYSSALYVGGSIVSDFLAQVFDITPYKGCFDVPKINARYSAQGVELKRWFNKFELGELQNNLDLFLQSEGEGSESYSFIGKNEYERLKLGYIDDLKNFIELTEFPNANAFLEKCKADQQESVKLQHIGLVEFSRLINGFVADKAENASLLFDFCAKAMGDNLSHLDKLRIEAIVRALPFALKAKTKLSKVGSAFWNTTSSSERLPFQRFNPMTLASGESFRRNFAVFAKSKVFPNVEVVSHHIPETLGSSFTRALEKAYGKKLVFNAYRGSGAKQLRLGDDVRIPSNTRVVHGHFPFNEKQLEQFPNAIHICWVRDPLERLWLHFNHILDFEQPISIHNKVHSLATQKGIADKRKLFASLLRAKQFASIKNTYKAYITPDGLEHFEFIGSVHKLDKELERLENLLGVGIERQTITRDLEGTAKRTFTEKAYKALKDEYAFIQKYL